MSTDNLNLLRDAVERVGADLIRLSNDRAVLAADKATLTAENAKLRDEIERLRPKPPAIELPDVVIQFGTLTLEPEGEGELWPLSGERRWFWDVDGGIRI